MRGQTAVEYLAVFSVALVVIAVAAVARMIDPARESGESALVMAQAREAVDLIASAVDSVYASGPGSADGVTVRVDAVWSLILDNENSEVKIQVSTSGGVKEFQASLRYPLNGQHTLPNLSSGVYVVVADWPTSNGGEGIEVVAENKIIRIHINPLEG